MTQLSPVFNVADFEFRGYTNPYLTPEQQQEVTLTESRVNSQLDFLAQTLGWNGPNYWSDLPESVNEKRQLLSGTFGVYNGYTDARVLEVRNWDSTVVTEKFPGLQVGQRAYCGGVSVVVESVAVRDDVYEISFGDLTSDFLAALSGNPLKFDCKTNRPAPFYRPQVMASGDSSFRVSRSGSALSLYPSYDVEQLFPYIAVVFYPGSTYYFDQPVYLVVGAISIYPTYEAVSDRWFLSVPEQLSDTYPVGVTGTLTWLYTYPASTATLQVMVVPWVDPSDWNTTSVLDYFTGAWGNKGGYLPFNLAFDALSLHGLKEENTIAMQPLSLTVDYSWLSDQVYSRTAKVDTMPPPGANEGDLWWNPDTGVLSAYYMQNQECPNWVEVNYRNEPTDYQTIYVCANVAAFNLVKNTLPTGTLFRITDCNGLSSADGIIGLLSPLTVAKNALVSQVNNSAYWTMSEVFFDDVAGFVADGSSLPLGVPVTLTDAIGLTPTTANILNLEITITGNDFITLIQVYQQGTWEIVPNTVLKFIPNSSSPALTEGSLWWDYTEADPFIRSAAVYYNGAWVQINSYAQVGVPPAAADLTNYHIYCNGNILTDGILYSTDNFYFSYTSAGTTVTFLYQPKTFDGYLDFPSVVISDSITTQYRSNLNYKIFDSPQYTLSPATADCETPLRLWKAQSLQSTDVTAEIERETYSNPFRADDNRGPGDTNWQRYFVRMPLDYGRNEDEWQKISLICQDFGYWGSTVDPEQTQCPPTQMEAKVYEDLILYPQPLADYTYVYCEPYLYSNIAIPAVPSSGEFENANIYPMFDEPYDEFSEATTTRYDPLHYRTADTTSNPGAGYGDWEGVYLNMGPCGELTGYLINDLQSQSLSVVDGPVWDASIYKYPPECENDAYTYAVDMNNYRLGYAYFVADASASEEAAFDFQERTAWRYPPSKYQLYLTPVG